MAKNIYVGYWGFSTSMYISISGGKTSDPSKQIYETSVKDISLEDLTIKLSTGFKKLKVATKKRKLNMLFDSYFESKYNKLDPFHEKYERFDLLVDNLSSQHGLRVESKKYL